MYYVTHILLTEILIFTQRHAVFFLIRALCALVSIADRSLTFQTPSTPLNGLAGTQVPVGPIEQVLNKYPFRALLAMLDLIS